MGLWLHELAPDRQANIDVVVSAFESVFSAGEINKAYMTMPITSGKRFYDVLEKFGVKSIEELEKKRPGALREEIIIPNIEEGRNFGAKISREITLPLIIPGIFEARKQRWSQEEYMALWLQILQTQARELYLIDGWEYTNGGAMEVTRAMLIRHRFGEPARDFIKKWSEVKNELPRIGIFDHNKQHMLLHECVWKLASAIKSLRKRGFRKATKVLLQQFVNISYISNNLNQYGWDSREYDYHDWDGLMDHSSVQEAQRSIGVELVSMPDQVEKRNQFAPDW